MKKSQIVIETKKKLFANRVGNHSSIFGGSGIEFKDIRGYSTSDSARHINWRKSTKDSVKVNTFSEDRELNIVVVYLNSGSLNFANKKSKAIEALTALSFASVYTKESLATIFFNNREQLFLKPTKKAEAVDINYQFANTLKYQSSIDYKELTKYVFHHIKRRSIVFIIGDFLDEVNLQEIAKVHETYSLIIRAKAEENLELLGELNIKDLNSNELTKLNIDKRSQKVYNKLFKEQDIRLLQHLHSCQIKFTKIYMSDNSVNRIKEVLDAKY